MKFYVEQKSWEGKLDKTIKNTEFQMNPITL